MILRLVADHECLARRARAVTEVAQAAGDPGTADLISARIAVHEKVAWMLRSLLTSEPRSACDSFVGGDRHESRDHRGCKGN